MMLWFIAQHRRTLKHTNDNRSSLVLEYIKYMARYHFNADSNTIVWNVLCMFPMN